MERKRLIMIVTAVGAFAFAGYEAFSFYSNMSDLADNAKIKPVSQSLDENLKRQAAKLEREKEARKKGGQADAQKPAAAPANAPAPSAAPSTTSSTTSSTAPSNTAASNTAAPSVPAAMPAPPAAPAADASVTASVPAPPSMPAAASASQGASSESVSMPAPPAAPAQEVTFAPPQPPVARPSVVTIEVGAPVSKGPCTVDGDTFLNLRYKQQLFRLQLTHDFKPDSAALAKFAGRARETHILADANTVCTTPNCFLISQKLVQQVEAEHAELKTFECQTWYLVGDTDSTNCAADVKLKSLTITDDRGSHCVLGELSEVRTYPGDMAKNDRAGDKGTVHLTQRRPASETKEGDKP